MKKQWNDPLNFHIIQADRIEVVYQLDSGMSW